MAVDQYYYLLEGIMSTMGNLMPCFVPRTRRVQCDHASLSCYTQWYCGLPKQAVEKIHMKVHFIYCSSNPKDVSVPGVGREAQLRRSLNTWRLSSTKGCDLHESATTLHGPLYLPSFDSCDAQERQREVKMLGANSSSSIWWLTSIQA